MYRFASACCLSVLCGILPVAAQTVASPQISAVSVVRDRVLHLRTTAITHGFSDADIARLRTRIAANAEVAQAWEANKAAADRLLAQPIEKVNIDPRRLDDTLEPLILAYRMTGDARYGTKLHEILRRLVARESWLTDKPLSTRKPVWHSDLGMGFAALEFGMAYDAIRPGLTEKQRKELTDGLIRGVVKPVFADWIDGRDRIHTLDTMGHNWWAHIVFGTGAGLVAILPDAPEAQGYLNRIDRAAREWWQYSGSRIETKIPTFDSDGGYSESVNYDNLAVGTYMEFLVAWKDAIVEAPSYMPPLDKAANFFLHNAYASSSMNMSVNFGDGNVHASGVIAFANLWAMGERRPEYMWYLNQFPKNEKGEEARKTGHFLVRVPLASEAEAKTPQLPTSALFRGMGWATMRSGWGADETLLAVRSGFTWNHNHADTGSFVLFHNGKPLLIDSGNCSYGYAEYDRYYRQNDAHSVATVNGKAEPAEDTYLGSHLSGEIPTLVDAGGIKYVFADATGPTSSSFSRNFRHFLWLDGVILVYDDLKAVEPGRFRWLLHTETPAVRKGPVLNVQNGAAAATVMPLFPMPFPDAGLFSDYPEYMGLEELQGYKDHDQKVRVPYYAFVAPGKSERMKFLNAIVPNTHGTPPRIERLQGENMIGVRITSDTRITDVVFNQLADGSVRHRNAINTLLGWDTDAYALAISYAAGSKPGVDKIERLFVLDGSYVRRDGTVLLDSLSKRNLVAEYRPGATVLTDQGQPQSEFAVHVPARTSLSINGTPMAVTGTTVRVIVP